MVNGKIVILESEILEIYKKLISFLKISNDKLLKSYIFNYINSYTMN